MENISVSEQRISNGRYQGVIEFTLTEDDCTAAATTQNIAIPRAPAAPCMWYARVTPQVNATATSLTALTAQVGRSGDPDAVMAAVDLFDAAVGTEAGVAGAEAGAHQAVNPTLLLASTGANLNAATLAVRAHFKVWYERLA